MKSIKKNILYAIIRSIIQTVFPVIVFFHASRILKADGIGKINFANSFAAYFILIGNLGINTYATREGAKVRDAEEKFSILVKEILLINILMTTISVISYYVWVINLDLNQ